MRDIKISESFKQKCLEVDYKNVCIKEFFHVNEDYDHDILSFKVKCNGIYIHVEIHGYDDSIETYINEIPINKELNTDFINDVFLYFYEQYMKEKRATREEVLEIITS